MSLIGWAVESAAVIATTYVFFEVIDRADLGTPDIVFRGGADSKPHLDYRGAIASASPVKWRNPAANPIRGKGAMEVREAAY